MSDDSVAQAAPRKPPDDGAVPPTDVKRERSVETIRKDVDDTIVDIKEHFGLLLKLRDRKITDLETKLEGSTRENARRLILVVDDAESTPDIMKRYLEGQPVDVVCVGGDRAMDHVEAEDHEVVLIEAAVAVGPDVDGMALCRELCEKDKGERVIVMSSRPGNTIKNAVERLGAGFLRKPFGRAELVQLVRNAFHGGQQ